MWGHGLLIKRGGLHACQCDRPPVVPDQQEKGGAQGKGRLGATGMFNQDIFRMHTIANHSKNNIKTKIIHLTMY